MGCVDGDGFIGFFAVLSSSNAAVVNRGCVI